MKNVKALLGILFLVLTMASCSSDDSTSNNGNNQLRIKASAVYTPTANRSEVANWKWKDFYDEWW
jgi:hypothetical protein